MRLVFASCVVAILSSSALVGEARADGPAAASITAYDWSGWYGGVNLGYGGSGTSAAFTGDGLSDYWTTGKGSGAGTEFVHNLMAYAYGLDPEFDPFSRPLVYTQSFNASGVFGGVQLGHNWQFGSNWLVGLETDLQLSGMSGGTDYIEPDKGPQGVRLGASSSQRLDWFGTTRARIGYLPEDRLLVFATGGLAYGQARSAASVSIVGDTGWTFDGPTFATKMDCPGHTTCFAGETSRVTAGWSVGGGLEYALSRRVTLKAEYLHVDLGDQKVHLTAQAPAVGDAFLDVRFKSAYDIVRLGLNYRF